MLVTEQTRGKYLIKMSEDEILHFSSIAANSPNMFISGVCSCIGTILQYYEKNWTLSFGDTFPDGNPCTDNRF